MLSFFCRSSATPSPINFIVVVPTVVPGFNGESDPDPTSGSTLPGDPSVPNGGPRPSRIRIPGQTYDSSDPSVAALAVQERGTVTLTVLLAMVGVVLATVGIVVGILLWRRRNRKQEGRRVMLSESYGRLSRSRSVVGSSENDASSGGDPGMVEPDNDDVEVLSMNSQDFCNELPYTQPLAGTDTMVGGRQNKRRAVPPPIQTKAMVQRSDSGNTGFSLRHSPVGSMTEGKTLSPGSAVSTPHSAFATTKKPGKVVTFMNASDMSNSRFKAGPLSAGVVQPALPKSVLTRSMSAASWRALPAPTMSKTAVGRLPNLEGPGGDFSALSPTKGDDAFSVLSGPSVLSIRDVQRGYGGKTIVSMSSGVDRGRLELVTDESRLSDEDEEEEEEILEGAEVDDGYKTRSVENGAALVNGTARSSPTLGASDGNESDLISWDTS